LPDIIIAAENSSVDIPADPRYSVILFTVSENAYDNIVFFIETTYFSLLATPSRSTNLKKIWDDTSFCCYKYSIIPTLHDAKSKL
jgi:hypothetical protein